MKEMRVDRGSGGLEKKGERSNWFRREERKRRRGWCGIRGKDEKGIEAAFMRLVVRLLVARVVVAGKNGERGRRGEGRVCFGKGRKAKGVVVAAVRGEKWREVWCAALC
ncbi:hypothetical protein HAX54_025161 [Datura stramonium]|uniref:Uncharacterized protein n=1 Tax=Datura stramonium TaxID=4076 RepID=A0ABS8V1K5_DATST|nr:hypothetical protein [Datura stramonium]